MADRYLALDEFAKTLFQTGQVVTGSWHPVQSASRDKTAAVVNQVNDTLALDAPHTPPALNVDAAIWSLEVLAWCCCLYVDRMETDTRFPIELKQSQPQGKNASEHWSVDLGFRFLHSFFGRCKRVAPNDHLLSEAVKVASAWPLAIVGSTTITGKAIEIDESKLEIITSNDCLRAILIDRIIDRSDDVLGSLPRLERQVAMARIH